MLPLIASADAVEINGIYYNLVSKAKQAEVTKNPNYYSGSIDIPASVDYDGTTYSVTSIGSDAFDGCSGLTSITFPNSVTSIGDYAFYMCKGLTSITIGSGIQYIFEGAFANCPDLTDVYCYAESVPSTEASAFDKSYIDYATLHVPVWRPDVPICRYLLRRRQVAES